MMKWLAVLVTMGVLAGAVVWRLGAKKAEAKQQDQTRQARTKAAPVVTVAEAKVQDVLQRVDAVGSIEAPFNTRVSSEVAGQIVFLEAREGDRVTRGQILARLDTAQIDSEIRQREAALAEAQARLAQARIAQTSTDATVTQQISHQEAAVLSAKADHKQASTNYDYLLAASKANIENIQNQVEAAEADIANANSAIQTAKANLDNAKVRYTRARTLLDKGYVSEQSADDARTTVEVREGELSQRKSELNKYIGTRDSLMQQKRQAENQGVIGKQKQLADIDAAAQRVRQAEAALKLAKANTAQTRAYQENLTALQSSVASAEANLRSSMNRRKDTIVRSPLDGYVTMRSTDPGAVTTVGQTILTLQAVRDVWFSAAVPEEASHRLSVGKTATVELDAFTGRKLTGRVVQINPSADPVSRQFMVRIQIDNSRNDLKAGMFGRMAIETGKIANAVVIPREGIQRTRDGVNAMVVDDQSVAHTRALTVYPGDSALAVVSSGLKPGEKVVILSAVTVKDGQTVKVTTATPDAGAGPPGGDIGKTESEGGNPANASSGAKP
jgi:RND family efflux transporter MFP subunit